MDVSYPHSREFGHAQAGLDGQQDHGVVASAENLIAVRSGEQSLHLFGHEEADQCPLGSLGWDRQNALDAGSVFWVTKRSKAEQGVHGGQSGVAGGDAGMAITLQMVQETCDGAGVEIGKVQSARGLPGRLG
jgi:hypothetical protein